MTNNNYNAQTFTTPFTNVPDWQLQQMGRQQVYKGPSGNPSQNLQEMQEVLAELRKRNPGKGIKNMPQPQQFVQITDRNETRLFKPLLPVNRFVHEDEHIEWLKGRTRAVCRKLAWATTAD